MLPPVFLKHGRIILGLMSDLPRDVFQISLLRPEIGG